MPAAAILGLVVLANVSAAGPVPASAETVRGTVTEICPDDFDERYLLMVLRSGNERIPAYLPRSMVDRVESLVDARIEVSGRYREPVGGSHEFAGPLFEIGTNDVLRVLDPPPGDVFKFPEPGTFRYDAAAIEGLGRRSVEGRVIAAWRGDRLLLDYGVKIGVFLAESGPLPPVGAKVKVSGYPGTDFTFINFHRATWKLVAEGAPRPETPRPITPARVLRGASGGKVDNRLHGHLVKIEGRVLGLRPRNGGDSTFDLACGGDIVPVDVTANPAAGESLVAGATVAVTGVCVLDITREDPRQFFPRVNGFVVVPRSPADVAVVSPAPWWTVPRLLVVIAALLVLLVVLFIRSRVRIFREQLQRTISELRVGERTRLAVELHDSLSQNLAGVAFQIAAGGRAVEKDPQTAAKCLDSAVRMLGSCRTELRNCLFDLRGNTLELADFDEAIRLTLKPISGAAEVTVRANIDRSRLLDSTVQAVLSILRELTANAVNHGGARHIRVAGGVDGEHLVFSVRDDGRGFDPATVPGPAEGHYGLEGIRDRLKRLGGSLEFETGEGKGTRAVVRLRPPLDEEKRK